MRRSAGPHGSVASCGDARCRHARRLAELAGAGRSADRVHDRGDRDRQGAHVLRRQYADEPACPGSIYAGDLRTGEGSILVPGETGRSAFGIFADNCNRLWVAGGTTGHLYVYDATTGALLKDYTVAPVAPRFINDVYVTEAAYVTNTSAPVIYRVPLGAGCELGDTFDTLTSRRSRARAERHRRDAERQEADHLGIHHRPALRARRGDAGGDRDRAR